ncbi:MAG: hypothetical protein R6V73_10720 [Anaerolineales bacterium]
MLIDIHRSVIVERHNYLLGQAEGWRLEKLANLLRRTRKAEKKAAIQPFALPESKNHMCCSMAAA